MWFHEYVCLCVFHKLLKFICKKKKSINTVATVRSYMCFSFLMKKDGQYFTPNLISKSRKKWKNTFISFLKHLYMCIRSALQLAHYAVTVTAYRGFKDTSQGAH